MFPLGQWRMYEANALDPDGTSGMNPRGTLDRLGIDDRFVKELGREEILVQVVAITIDQGFPIQSNQDLKVREKLVRKIVRVVVRDVFHVRFTDEDKHRKHERLPNLEGDV